MQMSASKSTRVRTVASTGRSSDLLRPERLPVVHEQTVAGVLFRPCAEAYSSGDCPGFSPDSLLFPMPDGHRKTSLDKDKEINSKSTDSKNFILLSGIRSGWCWQCVGFARWLSDILPSGRLIICQEKYTNLQVSGRRIFLAILEVGNSLEVR